MNAQEKFSNWFMLAQDYLLIVGACGTLSLRVTHNDDRMPSHSLL